MPGRAAASGIEFGSVPVKLEVKPLQSDSPTRTEMVLVVTLLDAQGKPCPRRRVEWNLEGVGNIVEVDPGNLFQGRGTKTNNSATTYTGSATRSIGRHNGNPADEILLGPGQTWLVVTSAIEGDTEVTISAADIANWDNKRVVATRRWSDAEWQFPTPAIGPAGMPLNLTTTIGRRSDHLPLAGYSVRYRFLDGTLTQFLPGLVNEITVQSDSTGKAVANLAQINPQAGRCRIAVEVLRQNGTRTAVGTPLATGEAIVEWKQPGILLRESSPESILVGEELVCRLAVTNTTLDTLSGLTVRSPIAEGANFVRSNPPAIRDGNQLVWTLAPLGSHRSASFDVIYQPKQAGTLIGKAYVRSPGGLHDEQTYQIKINPIPKPNVQIDVVGSTTALMSRTGDQVQGQPVSLQLVVRNQGTDPAPNAQLHVELEEGLQADGGQTSLDWQLGTLTPGSRKTIPILLKGTRTGTSHVKASVSADSGVSGSTARASAKNILARVEPVYTVRETGLELKLRGPAVRFVGTAFHWNLEVKNSGSTPLQQITVSSLLPPQLDLVEASDQGRLQGNEVIWLLDRLDAGQTRTLKLTTRAHAMGADTVVHARASAAFLDSPPTGAPAGQLTSKGEKEPPVGQPIVAGTQAMITFQGIAAYKMRVDSRGPIEVGDRAVYKITIENTGSFAGSNVQLAATLPTQMRLLSARGMNYRIDGAKVTFAPVASITPGQKLEFSIELLAEKPGDARLRAELINGPSSPVVQENSLHIVPRGD